MNTVLAVLDAVGATSKRTEKEAILQKHKDIPGLKRAVWLAEDQQTNFYVRKVLPYKPAAKGGSLEKALLWLENFLCTRKVTGGTALSLLKVVMEELSSDDATVIERVLLRDLRTGCGLSTYNKIWGKNFLKEYPVMLACKWDDVDHIEFPAYVQLKADGMRINVIVRNGAVEYRSRNGSLVDINTPELDNHFLAMVGEEALVFDGELLVRDEQGLIAPRKISNGICNKAIKGTISKEEISRLYFVFWDLFEYDVLTEKEKSDPYNERLQQLEKLVKKSSICQVLHTDIVHNQEEAKALFKKYREQGQEGAMLKNMKSLWQNDRTRDLIKMKAVEEADLMIVGWEEGKGRLKGKLGALVGQDASKKVLVNVGSGYTDKDRELKPEEVIGKIMKVEYNEVIQASDGSYSLYLPVFIGVREDKKKADKLV